MTSLLALINPYRWVLWLAFAGALVFGYFAWAGHQQSVGREEGRSEVQGKWDKEKTQQIKQLSDFNAENRRIEQRRQSIITEAINAAKQRETTNAIAAARLRAVNDSLRDDLATSRANLSSASVGSLRGRVTSLEAVLEQCTRANAEVAGDAAGLASDLQLMLQAWPKK